MTKTKRRVPFEALSRKQRERLLEAVFQTYEHDLDGLILEFVKRWSADELKEALDELDELDAA